MISVVIPAFNESRGIANTVSDVLSMLSKSGFHDSELIVVDDGSDDDTAAIAERSGAQVIQNPVNLGYGASLKRGIQMARHDTICIIDADLTYPVDRIPDLHLEYQRGFGMVVGARTGHHYSGGIFKGPLRKILKFMVEYAAGRKVPDANSGLRIFSKTAILSFMPHLCDGFSFTTTMTIALMRQGYPVGYFPIDYYHRAGSTKVKLFQDALKTSLYITQSLVYFAPMKLFLLFAFLVLCGSASAFFIGFMLGINAGYYLCLAGIVASVFFVAFGCLADLISRLASDIRQPLTVRRARSRSSDRRPSEPANLDAEDS